MNVFIAMATYAKREGEIDGERERGERERKKGRKSEEREIEKLREKSE